MAAPVPPGAPRPGYSSPPPPSYNPNLPTNVDGLSNNMQNLLINRQQGQNMGSVRPLPPFAQTGAAPGYPGTGPVARPGPPPGVLNRPVGPPAGVPPPNMVSGRPSGPPAAQPSPFAARGPPVSGPSVAGSPVLRPVAAPPGQSPSPFATNQALPRAGMVRAAAPPMNPPFGQPQNAPGIFSNGSPVYGTTGLPGGPPFTTPMTHQQPSMGAPPTMVSAGMPPPPMGPPNGPGSIPPGQPHSPFSLSSQGMPPPTGSPFGSQQSWPMQTTPMGLPPGMPGSQPSRMFGMQPPLPNQSMATIPPAMGQGGQSMVGPSKVDPNQIPRPIPSSNVTIYETRVGNQASPPPPASSDYIVRDTGNCSPRYMRCTISQIPCTSDILSTSGMQLALLVQPLAIPHPSEEPIQVVDFGESGPIRCSRCKGYINPFMKFIDQGRRFICNLCGYTDETPRDYHCNLGPDGRRRDADERAELCRGTVEFVASKEFMVREPMPAVFFFLIDVSMNAVQTGATAAACSAITQVIDDLPVESARTMVGIATYDSTIHFYNLRRALQQPLMLIVPDIQDVYTPLETDVIVPLSEYRQHVEQLLESIPTMFQSNKIADSAFGAAIKAAFLAMKGTGGKLLVFQSVLPSVGIGALSAREAEGRSNVSAGEKEAHKLLQPADKTLKTMAIEFAEYQVCVDVFLTTQSYVDIASISVVPRTTGGQVYYYYPFSAISDPAKLYNDLRWNVTRPQGLEAVMRVRCSQGLQVQEYYGNFCKRIPTDVDLAAIDCDKTIMVTLKHDDKLQDGSECSFQSALLYTTVYGQRRIRVNTLSLPCTSLLSNLFRAADLDTQFACFLKQAGNDIPINPLVHVKEQVINLCINILYSYRKYCATVSSSGQLILPEALKLLPLYTLALKKSIGLRSDGRIDDKSFWVNLVSSISTALAVPLVYPRMIPIHDLNSKEEDGPLVPLSIPLSSEHVSENGIYLLENGDDGLVYVGNSADQDVIKQLFGFSSFEEIPTQLVLQNLGNPLSKKLNDVVNEIRRQRCSYLRLRFCKKGDPTGMLFFSYMVEDKSPSGPSYVEFLVHVHRQIQSKMT
uniref:Uncharacterized protein n=1 Tax=Kalanchoe fedtschenkoi TaxID=63787 RepID=A0A7N0TRM7_KALFE